MICSRCHNTDPNCYVCHEAQPDKEPEAYERDHYQEWIDQLISEEPETTNDNAITE